MTTISGNDNNSSNKSVADSNVIDIQLSAPQTKNLVPSPPKSKMPIPPPIKTKFEPANLNQQASSCQQALSPQEQSSRGHFIRRIVTSLRVLPSLSTGNSANNNARIVEANTASKNHHFHDQNSELNDSKRAIYRSGSADTDVESGSHDCTLSYASMSTSTLSSPAISPTAYAIASAAAAKSPSNDKKSPSYIQRRPPQLSLIAALMTDDGTATVASDEDEDHDKEEQKQFLMSGNSKKFFDKPADYFDLTGLTLQSLMALTSAPTVATTDDENDSPINVNPRISYCPSFDSFPKGCEVSFGRHQDRLFSAPNIASACHESRSNSHDGAAKPRSKGRMGFAEYSHMWEVLQGLPDTNVMNEVDFYERITKNMLDLPLYFNKPLMRRVQELSHQTKSTSKASAGNQSGLMEVDIADFADFWDDEITNFDEMEFVFRLLKQPKSRGIRADDLKPIIQAMIEHCPLLQRRFRLFEQRLSRPEKQLFKQQYVALVVRRIFEQVNLLRNGEISVGEFRRSNLWATLCLEQQYQQQY